MAITAAAYPAAAQSLGPVVDRAPMTGEYVQITGSTGIVGDQTASYRLTQVHKNPQVIGGAFVIASSSTDQAGTSIVIQALVALGNLSTVVRVVGDF